MHSSLNAKIKVETLTGDLESLFGEKVRNTAITTSKIEYPAWPAIAKKRVELCKYWFE